MKKRWTEIYSYAKKIEFGFGIVFPDWNNLSEFGKKARFNDVFMRHHRNADMAHFNNSGDLLGVTYLTIIGANHKDNLFKLDSTEAYKKLESENKRLRNALTELADEPIEVDSNSMPDEYMTRKMMIEAAKLALGDYHATQEGLQSKDCQ